MNMNSLTSPHILPMTDKLLTATNQAPVIRVNSQWGMCVFLINSKWIRQIVYSILWDLRGYEGNQRKEWRGTFQKKKKTSIHSLGNLMIYDSWSYWLPKVLFKSFTVPHELHETSQSPDQTSNQSATTCLINISVHSTILYS